MIILYSSVNCLELFSRVGFYRDDLRALALYRKTVEATNSVRCIINKKPELLVCYFYSKSLFAGLIGRLVGSKVIFTGGADQISKDVNMGLRLYLHRVLGFFCLVVAHKILLSCSEDIKNFRRIACFLPFLLKKIVYSPHVVEVPDGSGFFSHQSAGCFKGFTICWMGSVENVKRKGVDLAVILIHKLRKIGVEATLQIAGTNGPGMVYINSLIERLGLSGHVVWLGAISELDKSKILNSGSIYIQLSKYEGFGLAAAEAFLSGAIVVHSNKGGLSDVINKNGFIVDIDKLLSWDDSAVSFFYSSILDFRVNANSIFQGRKMYSVEERFKSFSIL